MGQETSIADSVKYYESLFENSDNPDEFDEASRWLNRYYREQDNYDEDKVPEFDLPDPLITNDDNRVTDYDMWQSIRRPEILKFFERYVYGAVPEFEYQMDFIPLSTEENALGGIATRKEVRILFDKERPDLYIDLLIYLPNHVEKPVPAMMGLNFFGNQTVNEDDGIIMSEKWMRSSNRIAIQNNRATEATRGIRSQRWQVELIIQRGYALVTAYSGDVDQDEYNRMRQGVRSLAYDDQTKPSADEWGTISAWAWGLSRMMDYLELDPEIDSRRVAVMGHSRLGKAALWAGASDERFAITISNNSGCGGAALFKRKFGETVGAINTRFPHWFSKNFNRYNGKEEMLPVDQHMLISLIAPRPVYIASAEDDRWADPKGEFLSAHKASSVYQLYGLEGLPTSSMPDINQPVMGTIGYHIRSGRHDVTLFDWKNFLDFSETFF